MTKSHNIWKQALDFDTEQISKAQAQTVVYIKWVSPLHCTQNVWGKGIGTWTGEKHSMLPIVSLSTIWAEGDGKRNVKVWDCGFWPHFSSRRKKMCPQILELKNHLKICSFWGRKRYPNMKLSKWNKLMKLEITSLCFLGNSLKAKRIET